MYDEIGTLKGDFKSYLKIKVQILYILKCVNLIDIWKMAGSSLNRKIADWLRTDVTNDFIETVVSMLNTVPSGNIKSKKGKGGGTISLFFNMLIVLLSMVSFFDR
jgi:uncharacterized protein YehS (DUF1456 family)